MGGFIISVDGISKVQRFNQDALALENEVLALDQTISSPEIEPLLVQADDLEMRTYALYQKIDQMKTKQGLLVKQAHRTETRYAINLIDSESKEKIEKVQNAALSVRSNFLERVKQRQLQDLSTKLLFEITSYRKHRNQDPIQLLSLKERWKDLGDQCIRLSDEIKTNGLKLSDDATGTFGTALPGLLFCLETGLKAIEEFPKEPIVKLVDLIDLPLPTEPAIWEARKAEIEKYLLLLDPKLQSQIDSFVCLYSESKEENEWGKIHRYDNLEVFKKAFGCALWEYIKMKLQGENWKRPKTTAALPSLLDQFYRFATEKEAKTTRTPMDRSRLPETFKKQLTTTAQLVRVPFDGTTVVAKEGKKPQNPSTSEVAPSGGTTVVTKEEAVEENEMQKLFRKNHLPPVLPVLDIPEISKTTGPQNAEQYAKLKAPLRSKKLCRALYIEAGQETFQKILYGEVRPHVYHVGSGYTIRIKEKSELEKIQRMLETACQFDGIELEAQRAFIRGCLNSLPLPHRYKVEEFVYRLSKDPQKGGLNWGKDHAYDNPQILLDAVKKTIETSSSKQMIQGIF